MRVAVIGEGMLELSSRQRGWSLGSGGDALNVATHLARLGRKVWFISALGSDPFSRELREAWAGEAIDVTHLLTHPDRVAGLYAIHTDESGERSFTYWRSQSAARTMFALPGIEGALAAAADADLLCFSLISLAILPDEARERIAQLCREVRARGGLVAFDGNYRPALWERREEALAVMERFAGLCDIGLPTHADEVGLRGSASADETADHWFALGARRVVVKLGAQGCLYADGAQRLIVPSVAASEIVDSSGAGDAFGAGFCNAILQGLPPEEACRAGHRLAAWVIGRPGAIPAIDDQAPYRQIDEAN